MKRFLKYGGIVVGVILLFMTMVEFNKQDEEAIKNCIEKTGNQTYCERSILETY